METSTLGLRREARRARYRYAGWMAGCAGVSAASLLALALWAGAAPPAPRVQVLPAATVTRTVVVPVVTPPHVVVIPVAPPALPVGDLGPCPAPHRDRVHARLAQPSGDEPVAGFAAAPSDSRWLAAWTATHLFVSRDGGGSWRRVLDGAGAVLDATFDCHGRVLALRAGSGLGVRDGTREVWRAVAGVAIATPPEPYTARSYMPQLVGGGRAIAVVGPRHDELDQAYAAISDDGGVSWRQADLEWYEGGRLAAAWSGSTLRVVVPWTDCMAEGLRLVTVHATGVTSVEIDEYAGMVALDGGAIHGLSWECPDGGPVCTWRAGRGWRTPRGAAALGGDAGDAELVDGPVDVVIADHELRTLAGGRLGRPRPWPAGWTALGTDPSGRVWGTDAAGKLARR